MRLMTERSALGAWAALLLGAAGAARGASPRITELMALNTQTLIDDDQERSDWIEIHNPGPASVNLAGWHLTDVQMLPEKWAFPSVVLPANAYLVVFASEKDRRALGAPLHTNFRLGVEGDYLALVDPSGTRVSEFRPRYPPQRADVSYALGREGGDELVLLVAGAPARALIPTNGDLGLAWTEVEFDDGAWLSGTTGVGYDYPGLVGLDVRQMRNVNRTVYIRIPFQLDSVPELDALTLNVRFEDGIVVYLNGQFLTSENEPETLAWNAGAPQNRDDSTAVVPIAIDISSARDLLRPGANVLAVHGLNYQTSSTDLLVLPELIGRKQASFEASFGFCETPTPGLPNGATYPRVVGPVTFSREGGTFVEPFSLELELPPDAAPGAEIRYTLNGALPTAASSLYAGPLTIQASTQVRAKAFEPAGGVGLTSSATYLYLQASVRDFSSNLPLVVLDNLGGGWPNQNAFQRTYMAIFEPGADSRTRLTSGLTLQTRAGIKIRGSSTAWRPKPSLSVEAWDEVDEDKNISPLGMPPESDWVLWGPYEFDLTLMHNPLIYEISNRVGRYAVRTRFVEVFLNTDGGGLASGDYWGVYALMEKITRDEDRVDVERLFPEHDREPYVSGGYVLKIDRADPGDSGFYAAGQTLLYVYPKEVDIERPERDPQETYIRGFFRDFGNALNAATYTDPAIGYAKYVDVDSWIDHHLLNVASFNVDAFRLSGFMFKRRGGKLEMGPIWDFDRAMGSTDGRDINPLVWRAQTGDRGTDFFNYPWWGRMFTDLEFFQRYIDRYYVLRLDQFNTYNVQLLIESMAAELREAQVRNLQRWGQTPRYGGYEGEISQIKQWFGQRFAFMDGQFVSAPRYNRVGGQIAPDMKVRVMVSRGTAYYTLDGTDPRLPGGAVAPQALPYTEEIPVRETMQIVARAYNPSHTSLTGPDNPPLSSKWSAPAKIRFHTHRTAASGDLAISEINYHPSDPTGAELAALPTVTAEEFEFLEIKNIGADVVDLYGLRFDRGLSYEFSDPAGPILAPGEYLILVRNATAFAVRYPGYGPVAGVFSEQLDNGGEALRLVGPTGNAVIDMEYRDGWYAVTDGLGFTLVLLQEGADPVLLSSREAWRASSYPGGSPGQADPAPPGITAVVINELLSFPEAPALDSVELHNPTGEDADIGGWFLTDDRTDPRKYRFAPGTVIASGDYLVVTEAQFNPLDPGAGTAFGLSSAGEEVYLFSATLAGQLTGYVHGLRFGAARPGVSFGRHIRSDGVEDFPAQAALSLDGPNSGPSIGPLVLSEIMYHPPASGGASENVAGEFIEIANISGAPVALREATDPDYAWRIGGVVEFSIPTDAVLDSGEALLLVKFDPALDAGALQAFRDTYDVAAEVQVYGPYLGTLENEGGAVELYSPLLVQGDEGGGVSLRYVLVDRVRYANAAPWPPEPGGTGAALERRAPARYGNDPASWAAAAPTAGVPSTGGAAPAHWAAY